MKGKMMANTFTQIYIQLVFVVKGRNSLIRPEWEEELYKYIAGILRNKNQKLLAINGMPDHLHILINFRPSISLSELVREIKKSSNTFITEKKFINFPFYWQEGYGAFSYSLKEVSNVIRYIENQKEHHKKFNFWDEFKALLKEFEVEHEDKYLFERVE